MSRYLLSALLGVAGLSILPSVSSAQYNNSAYSPYYYSRHGSYIEPNYYSAPGVSPSSYAGTATAVYGNSYSPYDYLRHGSYSWPAGPDSYAQPSYYSYSPPVVYRYARPIFSGSVPSGNSATALTEEEQEPPANVASIQVRVPENAEIWFENGKTSQTGAVRHFVSPPLETGRTFTYDIRAHWTDGAGKAVERTRQVKVEAGKRSTVDFVNANTKTNP